MENASPFSFAPPFVLLGVWCGVCFIFSPVYVCACEDAERCFCVCAVRLGVALLILKAAWKKCWEGQEGWWLVCVRCVCGVFGWRSPPPSSFSVCVYEIVPVLFPYRKKRNPKSRRAGGRRAQGKEKTRPVALAHETFFSFC